MAELTQEQFNRCDGLVNESDLESFTDLVKEIIAQLDNDIDDPNLTEGYLKDVIHNEMEGFRFRFNDGDVVYTRICIQDELKFYHLVTPELHKKVTELRKAANSALNIFLYDEELEKFLRENKIKFDMDEPADSNPAIPIITVHEDDLELMWEKADACDDDLYLKHRLIDNNDDNKFHWSQDLEDWLNEFNIRYAVVIK